jgi:hypothetical protein
VNLVKKVVPPFSQDSPEMKGTREKCSEQSFIHLSTMSYYNLKYMSFSINPFLAKKKILSNDDFPLFKEENPLDTI